VVKSLTLADGENINKGESPSNVLYIVLIVKRESFGVSHTVRDEYKQRQLKSEMSL